MSLTSYRAAPPRVKTIGKREARDHPAAAYVAIVTGLEKPARIAFVAVRHDVAFRPHNVLYFSDAGETRLAAERGGGGGVARRGTRHPRRGTRGDRRSGQVRGRVGARLPPGDEALARAAALGRAVSRGGGEAAARRGARPCPRPDRRAQRTVGARRACRSRKARPYFICALDHRTAPADRSDQTSGGDDAQR